MAVRLCAQDPGATQIIDEANKLLRGSSSHARLSMNIRTPKWERTLEIEAWNKGRAQSLLRIHAPAKEQGNGTLRKEKEIWNWLPAVERVIKVPPSMLHNSWMGSDFTYEDIIKADSIVKDYTHRTLNKKPANEGELYIILATPKADAPVVWGKVIFTALKTENSVIPVKEEDYSERGELIRTVEFFDIKNMSGKRVPTRVECRPQKRPDHKTVLLYRSLELDLTIPDIFFSLSTVQKPLP